jgi:hypothetical protein
MRGCKDFSFGLDDRRARKRWGRRFARDRDELVDQDRPRCVLKG